MLLFVVGALYGDIFSKGKADVGVSLGASNSYEYNYTVVGVSGNYFIVDNLGVGGMYRSWFGSGPTQNELSVFTNYYIPVHKQFRPYVGVFGRKTFVSGNEIADFYSYGGRAGVGFVTSKNSYLSVGYAIEYYSNCFDSVFGKSSECHRSYPELVFGLSF